MIVCVWGSTKARVAELLKSVPKSGTKKHRVTWRLTDAFTTPIGDGCYAPDDEEIREAYSAKKLRVLKKKKDPIDEIEKGIT